MSLVNFAKVDSTSNNYFGSYYYNAFINAYNAVNPNTVNFRKFKNNSYNSNKRSSIADRAVEIAEAELNKGVRETSKNDSTDIRRYKNGAKNSNPWCASFVSYIYGSGQNRSNNNTFGYTASSQAIKAKALEANCFAGKNSGYIPRKGDLAIWTNVGDSAHGHVGIITKTDKNGFWVIEGNSDDNAVSKIYYRYSDLGKRFSGYAQMSKWLNSSGRLDIKG